MPVTEATYRQVALEDREGKWELHCGQLRSKPSMTIEHNDIAWLVGFRLQQQLSLNLYRVRVDAGRGRRSASQF